ncbi:type IX secretion system membrane protein PorP/SprF [Flavobacterium sp. ZT3R18]|uniref:PorP/SprF family type IX secretion system membrane protein n=1 Tax=Flavobacterium sp. ZT3R18 TaxID=2594429 RepID=UPI001179B842|nr:type IX secretion system membrane protein PorP/SprF [Flavobacterium sp. ZT3R18]TRX32075.1 type IX secretion system membrane protein PorP/SprF [Flavobacterium sp. ZT3R18]
MKKIVICFLLLTVASSYSQELNAPVATQYLADNPFVISPTYAGIGDNFRVNLNGYKQWVGIENAPQNQSLYADFRVLDKSGVGLTLYNDSNGNTHQAGGKLSFSHHIILDYYSKQYLSFGISYIYNSFRLDLPNSTPSTNDPGITDNRATTNNNFEIGFLYRFKNFYASATATNILQKNLDFTTTKLEPNLLTNYQLYSGYVFDSGNRSELEPSVFYQLYQSDGRSVTDFNLKYRKYNRYEDYYWVGASYRFLNDQIGKPLAVGPIVGLQKGVISFGYSYQVTLNGLAAHNSGTHSLTIGFRFLQGVSNCPCTDSPVHE